MDYVSILDKTDKYVKSIINSEEFGFLLELKKKIDEDLKDVIFSFKEAQNNYNEALKYGKYHPNLKEYQQAYSLEKSKLYSNELVKKYNEVQQNIQYSIDCFLKDLTSSISNKFKTMSTLKI